MFYAGQGVQQDDRDCSAMFGLASYWMGIGSFGGVFSWKGRRRVSEMKLFMYIEIMCVSWCFLRWFLIIFTYLCVMHIVFQELVVFSVLDCFSSALEVVAVLMLIVYVLEAWKKICIINKHVESVGGKWRSTARYV